MEWLVERIDYMEDDLEVTRLMTALNLSTVSLSFETPTLSATSRGKHRSL